MTGDQTFLKELLRVNNALKVLFMINLVPRKVKGEYSSLMLTVS